MPYTETITETVERPVEVPFPVGARLKHLRLDNYYTTVLGYTKDHGGNLLMQHRPDERNMNGDHDYTDTINYAEGAFAIAPDWQYDAGDTVTWTKRSWGYEHDPSSTMHNYRIIERIEHTNPEFNSYKCERIDEHGNVEFGPMNIVAERLHGRYEPFDVVDPVEFGYKFIVSMPTYYGEGHADARLGLLEAVDACIREYVDSSDVMTISKYTDYHVED